MQESQADSIIDKLHRIALGVERLAEAIEEQGDQLAKLTRAIHGHAETQVPFPAQMRRHQQDHSEDK